MIINYFKNLLYKLWCFILSKYSPQPLPPQHTMPTTSVKALADLMVRVNSPYTSYYPLTSKIINAFIGTISASAALDEAGLIITNSKKQNLDYVYLASCIFQESKFFPACFNKNLAEHNGIDSFEGTDWGMCQMSGFYLSSRPGIPPQPQQPHAPLKPVAPTQEEEKSYQEAVATYSIAYAEWEQALTKWQTEASNLAMSAKWAVPTMAQIMHDNIKQATTDLPSVSATLKRLNTTSLSDVQFLATLYYNSGASGGLQAVKELNYSRMQHPIMVGKWYTQFKVALETGIHPPDHIISTHKPFTEHIKR